MLQKCIRKGTVTGIFVPVLCGSAFKNKGVQPLLDAVVDYLPSPLDVPPMNGIDVDDHEVQIECKASDSAPFAGLAFKVMNDPFVGSLTFVRIYSGVLNASSAVMNTVKDQKERVGRMLLMHANNREDVKEARAGDIVALAGLKNTTTGDTLCDPDNLIILEEWSFQSLLLRWLLSLKQLLIKKKWEWLCLDYLQKIHLCMFVVILKQVRQY